MPSEVVVDTAGLTIWAWSGEELHAAAEHQWRTLLGQGDRLLIAKPVLFEALSVLQHRLGLAPAEGHQVAVLLKKLLYDFSRFGDCHLLDLTKSQEQAAWEIFERGKAPEMTFSDCLCVAIARRRNIPAVFSSQSFYRAFGLTPLLAAQ